MKSMRKIAIIWTILAALLGTLILTNCQVKTPPTLAGTYQRLQNYEGTDYAVQLEFTEDLRLIWSPLDSIPEHTASETLYELLEDNHFQLVLDTDCPGWGEYAYTIADSVLTLTVVTDECEPRVTALSGEWKVR